MLLSPKSPEIISTGPVEGSGVVVVHGVGLGQEVADTVVVDGQTGQAVGVVDGHEHSVVVVLPISGVVVVHGKGLGQVGQPVGVVVSSLGEVVIVVVVDVIVANFFGG